MSRVVFAPAADTDLDEIVEYIARDKPQAAIKYVDRIRETCKQIGSQPYLGQARPEFAGGDLRVFPCGAHVIFLPGSR
jgi:toxin ParE1/3/4